MLLEGAVCKVDALLVVIVVLVLLVVVVLMEVVGSTWSSSLLGNQVRFTMPGREAGVGVSTCALLRGIVDVC